MVPISGDECAIYRLRLTGDPYFSDYAVTGSVTKSVRASRNGELPRYRFDYLQANTEGGSCYRDEAALEQTDGPPAPVISSIYPRT